MGTATGKCFRAGWRKTANNLAGVLLLVAALQGSREGIAMAQSMKLTAASFQNGWIPAEFTCRGAGISPGLTWSAPPAGTVSFALTVTDPDAPGGTFTHWVLYGLPAGTRALPEGVPSQGQLANGARQGRNDMGSIGYGGPCPPGTSAHRYVFALYALDARLNLPAGASRAEAESAIKGHTLARGELIGLYKQ
jgi:Raf kinase inhibitor-like YbhB/YbcL family protein